MRPLIGTLIKALRQLKRSGRHLQVRVNVPEPIAVRIKQQLSVPLQTTLTVPISAEVLIDTVIHTTLAVPIDLVLDERNLALEGLEVSLDDEIRINEVIDLNLEVPLAATVKAYNLVNVPVEAMVPLALKVPLNHLVKLRGTLRPQIHGFTIPLKTTVTVAVAVPIKQRVQIQATVEVPLAHNLEIPIDQRIVARSDGPVCVRLEGIGLAP